MQQDAAGSVVLVGRIWLDVSTDALIDVVHEFGIAYNCLSNAFERNSRGALSFATTLHIKTMLMIYYGTLPRRRSSQWPYVSSFASFALSGGKTVR